MPFRRLVFSFLILVPLLRAGPAPAGKVTGVVVEPAAAKPVEFVAVSLKSASGDGAVRRTATDHQGRFAFEDLPSGKYTVSFGTIGSGTQVTPAFSIDAAHHEADLGRLTLAEAAVKMEAFQVNARREAFYNSIDRKVYNVGKDIQSATGSASDLLQNIPSVQVDIEGNVSLRGDENVLILVNGKASTAMGPNRAAVLEQLPADLIEKIEVITNPSAMYKPDGTAGIINLTLKKKHGSGYSGAVRVNVGNDDRYNTNVSANYNPGRYNLFGNFGLRQDDRQRMYESHRRHLDPATGAWVSTDQVTREHSRPLSRIGMAGIDFHPDASNQVGFEGSYNYRTLLRRATQANRSADGSGAVASDYDRLRTDPEFERDIELKGTFQHAFADEGRELKIEVKRGRTTEQEDNHYTNLYRIPAGAPSFDNVRITPVDTKTEGSIEYTHPLAGGARLEGGFSREDEAFDADHLGTFADPASGRLVTDASVTNRFRSDSSIHALYGTYGRTFGSAGLLAGLRMEDAVLDTTQVVSGIGAHQGYFKFYPTLHLSYSVSEGGQLQLNYSHRVRRPDAEDLNPFPEYQDPFNLRTGNPALRPEEIHSIETGYQYKAEGVSYLATAYYRYLYRGFTQVTRYINSTTLLTTRENLAESTSGGVELAASREVGARASLNFSSNIFYNEIDASNLGFAGKRSTLAWNAKLSANFAVSKATLFQLNTNYTAKRLTPQGYRLPTFVANIGLKHELADRKTAFVLTVTDLFDTLRERTVIDTPILHDELSRRRSSRAIYAGVVYNFGQSKKKAKDEALPYDEAP
ncbi:MAG: hypothetical protein JWM88_2393 [Verrucomicrobia bacterium]|nr:hypothetical protein [Verrucomicrobiota bacterium]